MQYCQMNFNSANVEKYAYISVSIHYFAFAINSSSVEITTYVNNVIIEKKKKLTKRKERRRNAHCDTMKIIIFLLYTSYNCLLYCCTTVYVYSYFWFSIFAALLFIFAAAINIRS